jgi:hypothetical protein
MDSISFGWGGVLVIEKNGEQWNCQKCGAELNELKINE